ncbi:MAG: hypothetical protein CMJ64_27850 [Planctomycetaceae bacterium]|nr:hypothetical protein [Planctomycetaceae bacterium]
MTRYLLILTTLSLTIVSPSFSQDAHQSRDGNRPLPFLMAADFEDLNLVAWRVEQGAQDAANPLLEPEMPWDEGGIFSHGTVLRDPIDGKWKAWQISTPLSEQKGPSRTWKQLRRLTYLESADGVHWNRPKLPFVSWEGHEQTNILMESWASYASVNIAPNRPWPYEMFVFLGPTLYDMGSGVIEGLPLPDGKNQHPYGLYRFRSKDGKAWKAIEGPINFRTADSCFLYRANDDQYVAFHKTERSAFPGGVTPWDIGDGVVRLIGRRTSKDGSTWSDPTQLVMTPDWRDSADTQFMELCPLAVPGGYVATVTVYHNFSQRIDLQWAASRDGITWWRPGREPSLPNPPVGDYGGGMIWPMQTPIVDDQKLYVYYSGNESLHGDLFNTKDSGPRRLKASGDFVSRLSSSLPNYGALCRAAWTRDRLWALTTAIGGPYVGTATTRRQQLAGKKLRVNVTTRSRGELRVELLDDRSNVLPGFSRNDCHSIQGDHHAKPVSWSGGTEAPPSASKVRFVLKRAFLYGFGIE